jgi:hypothetical protein
MILRTFVLDRAAMCTVVWSVEENEIRIKIGCETLTPRDLETVNRAVADLLRERHIAATARPRRRQSGD